jgi:hypothetical protein
MDKTFGRFHNPLDLIHPRDAGAASSEARKGPGERDALLAPSRGDFPLGLEVDRTRFIVGLKHGWITLQSHMSVSLKNYKTPAQIKYLRC